MIALVDGPSQQTNTMPPSAFYRLGAKLLYGHLYCIDDPFILVLKKSKKYVIIIPNKQKKEAYLWVLWSL